MFLSLCISTVLTHCALSFSVPVYPSEYSFNDQSLSTTILKSIQLGEDLNIYERATNKGVEHTLFNKSIFYSGRSKSAPARLNALILGDSQLIYSQLFSTTPIGASTKGVADGFIGVGADSYTNRNKELAVTNVSLKQFYILDLNNGYKLRPFSKRRFYGVNLIYEW